jgi:hypothetical protein
MNGEIGDAESKTAGTPINTEIMEPCPFCNSQNLEERGKKYWFQIGLCTTVLFILIGFIMPFLWICTLAGIFFMIAAPKLPKYGFCKDCKKVWKYSA